VGCNVQVEYITDSNEIGRIKPVYNPAVNQWWMCDDGRLFYHEYEKIERLQQPQIRTGKEFKAGVNWSEVLSNTMENLRKFKSEEIAVVGNGFATNEENFLLQQIFSEGLKVKNIGVCDRFTQEKDVVYPKFTIKGEKLPNWQGAVDILVQNSRSVKFLKEN